MKFLVYDCTADFMSAALFINFQIHNFEKCQTKQSNHSESITSFLENFLIKNKASYQDLDYLIFLNGPSSFIRIRIGIAHAFGIEFALQNKIKLMNLNLFDIYKNLIIKNNFQDQFEKRIIILKAFGGKYFIDFQSDCKKDEFEQKIISEEELMELIVSNNLGLQNESKFNLFFDIEETASFLKNNNLSNLRFKIFDLENISIEAGNLACELLASKQNLERCFEIKPFYLLNPIFRKLND